MAVNPKLPMRNKAITKSFYINKLGFEECGQNDFDGYLMLQKNNIEIHFFEFSQLNPSENYGQVYIRTNNIEELYDNWLKLNVIHPNGHLEIKPWQQREFSVLDPDNNLLTFGQGI